MRFDPATAVSIARRVLEARTSVRRVGSDHGSWQRALLELRRLGCELPGHVDAASRPEELLVVHESLGVRVELRCACVELEPLCVAAARAAAATLAMAGGPSAIVRVLPSAAQKAFPATGSLRPADVNGGVNLGPCRSGTCDILIFRTEVNFYKSSQN